MRRLLGDALTIGVIFVAALAVILGALLALTWIVVTVLSLDAIAPGD